MKQNKLTIQMAKISLRSLQQQKLRWF